MVVSKHHWEFQIIEKIIPVLICPSLRCCFVEVFEANLSTLKEQVVSKPELPQQYDNILCIGNTLPFILE